MACPQVYRRRNSTFHVWKIPSPRFGLLCSTISGCHVYITINFINFEFNIWISFVRVVTSTHYKNFLLWKTGISYLQEYVALWQSNFSENLKSRWTLRPISRIISLLLSLPICNRHYSSVRSPDSGSITIRRCRSCDICLAVLFWQHKCGSSL